jgi:hypothetical protein
MSPEQPAIDKGGDAVNTGQELRRLRAGLHDPLMDVEILRRGPVGPPSRR